MSFAPFNSQDTTVGLETVVAPMWTGGLTTLTSSNFYTSSLQQTAVPAGLAYLDVYQLNPASSGSAVQFSIAYGNISGSGSAPYNTAVVQNTPTRDIYSQFKNLIWGDLGQQVSFGGGTASADFYVITVARSRFKEALYPGSLNLKLSGSAGIMSLTDNSANTVTTQFIGSNEFFYLVSGSNGSSYNGTAIQTPSGSYGLVFPNIGCILLNAAALNLSGPNGGISLVTDRTTSTAFTASYNTNANTMFQTMTLGGLFSLQSEENVSSLWLFAHANAGDFNYTTNPSIVDGNGNIIYNNLINNPQTFVTTVGLYDSQNNLLAVAKLSKPVKKDFVTPLLFSIKLSF